MPIIKHSFWGVRKKRDHFGRTLYEWGIKVVGKPPKADLNPYEFAAEYVCGELANALRLPVAKGVIAVEKNRFWYCSLHYNVSMPENPPPIFPESDGILSGIDSHVADNFIRENPRICCGITAFDIWVCNHDRSNGNIAIVERPKGGFDVFIFDHGEALIRSPDPAAWLSKKQNDLGIDHHILAPRLQTLGPMFEWIERIQQVPEYFIRDVLQESTELGVPDEVAEFCCDFLLSRRKILPKLLDDNRISFPHAPQLLSFSDSFPFTETADEPAESKQKVKSSYPPHLTWGGNSESHSGLTSQGNQDE